MAKKEPTKISAKIWRQTIDKLEMKLDAACLRRDAYLSRVLAVELPHLEREICLSNSPDANRFVASRLELLGERKLVTFSLQSDVADRLNEICEQKLIVRDAFLNRLLLLLAASPTLIDKLFFKDVEDDWRTSVLEGLVSPSSREGRTSIVWEDDRPDGPFFNNAFYPLEPLIDPFWSIRLGIEKTEVAELSEYTDPATGSVFMAEKGLGEGVFWLSKGIYSLLFDDKQFKDLNLYGLNCFVPDWRIPGHEAERRHQKKLDELFGD